MEGGRRTLATRGVTMADRITAGAGGPGVRYRYRRPNDRCAWQLIEKTLAVDGRPFGDRHRVHRAIRRSINWYFGNRSVWDGLPRSGPIRRQLAAVVDAGDSFYATLAACDGAAMARLSRHAGPRPFEHLMMDIAEIRAATVRALNSLPVDKGGALPDLPLHRLLQSLAELWEVEHGIPPPRPQWFEDVDSDSGEDCSYYQENPFLALCEAVATLARIEPKGKTALPGQILRAVFTRT